MAGNYHDIKSGAPSILTLVTLHEETWVTHIRVEHPDVPYAALVQTVEDPCLICESKTVEGHFVFVNELQPNKHGDPLRVPVAPHGDGTGTVKTAYFSGANSHGNVIWKRGDD